VNIILSLPKSGDQWDKVREKLVIIEASENLPDSLATNTNANLEIIPETNTKFE